MYEIFVFLGQNYFYRVGSRSAEIDAKVLNQKEVKLMELRHKNCKSSGRNMMKRTFGRHP